MKGTHIRAARDSTRQLRQLFPEEINASRVRNVSAILYVWGIQVAAAALCDLNDGMVIFARNLHDEVIHSAGPYLEASIGQWSFGGHYGNCLRVAIGAAGRVLGLCGNAATTAWMNCAAGISPQPQSLIDHVSTDFRSRLSVQVFASLSRSRKS